MNSLAQPLRAIPYSVFVLVAVVTSYLTEKEVGWDVLNYHLYSGFNAFNDRFSQDYFAAGPQSYFNPYAYAPFYLLIKAGLPALLVASILAAFQSAVLIFAFELGVLVSPIESRRMRTLTGICAAASAYLNPILLQQLGSSFADITTAGLEVGGWLLLAQTVRAPSMGRIIFGGILMGIATALKPTNAVHSLAAIGVLAFSPLAPRAILHQMVKLSGSMAAGFALAAAPWCFKLTRAFGNPFFPLMNGVFRSPEFTTESLRHMRFVPDNFYDALLRPFQIVDPATMIQEELRAPDLRYAALLLVAVYFIVRWLRERGKSDYTTHPIFPAAPSRRILTALGLAFSIDWTLWLAGSGNGRYFLPAATVGGVVLVGIIFSAFSLQSKSRNYLLVILLALQSLQLAMGTDFRWHSAPWGGQWFDVSMPAKLRTEASLYLTIGGQTNAFIAPYLSPASGLINFSGGYALNPHGASGPKIKALETSFGPNLRVLLRGDRLHADGERTSPLNSQVNTALLPFGLIVDSSDCVTIVVTGVPPELEFTFEASKPSASPNVEPNYISLVSCHLVPSAVTNSEKSSEQHDADQVLDLLEDACPDLFKPRRPLTEYNGRQWLRRYDGTDLAAWVSSGQLKFVQAVRGSGLVNLGSEHDWLMAPKHLVCGRRHGVYFAKIAGDVGGK